MNLAREGKWISEAVGRGACDLTRHCLGRARINYNAPRLLRRLCVRTELLQCVHAICQTALAHPRAAPRSSTNVIRISLPTLRHCPRQGTLS